VALFGQLPNVLLVNPEAGFNSVKDLVERARAQPGKLNYGSNGNGTTNHLSTELLKSLARVHVVHIPYRGTEMAKKNVPVLQSTLELISVGEIYVRSNNTEKTSRYNLANLSLSVNKPVGQGFMTGFLRVDNLTDKLYAASTIGDQEFGRYYEPGAPRNWLLGLKYSIAL